jgi:hypothetical protein
MSYEVREVQGKDQDHRENGSFSSVKECLEMPLEGSELNHLPTEQIRHKLKITKRKKIYNSANHVCNEFCLVPCPLRNAILKLRKLEQEVQDHQKMGRLFFAKQCLEEAIEISEMNDLRTEDLWKQLNIVNELHDKAPHVCGQFCQVRCPFEPGSWRHAK